MQHTAIDEQDGGPIWVIPRGGELIPAVALIQRLAVGVRCETWLGWSRLLWCPAIVKIARPHQVSRSRRTLNREVSALTDNLHPVLPRLYGSDIPGGTPHIISEYIDGPALDELIVEDDDPAEVAAAALITIELLGGVLALHRRGLAHLDVKPENVIMRAGRPVLIDFGSARPIGRAQPAGHPIGTLGFAAPEMEDCQPISSAMDIFAIGATVLAWLSGRTCADGETPTITTTLAATPTLAATLAGYRLIHLLGRMTDPDQGRRPSVVNALEAVADLFDPCYRPWPAGVTLLDAATRHSSSRPIN